LHLFSDCLDPTAGDDNTGVDKGSTHKLGVDISLVSFLRDWRTHEAITKMTAASQ
jgi:hypothetical protein